MDNTASLRPNLKRTGRAELVRTVATGGGGSGGGGGDAAVVVVISGGVAAAAAGSPKEDWRKRASSQGKESSACRQEARPISEPRPSFTCTESVNHPPNEASITVAARALLAFIHPHHPVSPPFLRCPLFPHRTGEKAAENSCDASASALAL
jgi:hypothetical protein